MKKIFGISLVAVLASLPMLAKADITTTQPTHDNNGPAAAAAPKYKLATSSSTDTNVATAGYVKGAYNAAIKGINYIDSEVESLSGDFDSLSIQISNLATKEGVKATIDSASVSGTLENATASVSVSGLQVSGTAAGNANGSFVAMSEWGNDSSTSDVPVSASFSGLSVTATANAVATGTATGTVSGSVSVDTYHS